MNALQLSRFVLGFSWIYSGLFTKLIHTAPLEKQMLLNSGFPYDIGLILSKSAGVIEIIFGVLIITFYRNKLLLVLNIVALLGFLVFVAISSPMILIDAFNPITTNFPLIVLSFVLFDRTKQKTL